MERAYEVSAVDGKLKIMEWGTEFGIIYQSKTGVKKRALISVGPTRHLFYALFEEDDVDFQLEINNQACKNRSVGYKLEIHRQEHRFMQLENSCGVLETLDSHKGKFHFVRQSSDDGQGLISAAAHNHKVSYKEASIFISQIKFNLQYSKRMTDEIPIVIKNIITMEEPDNVEKKVTIFTPTSEKVETLMAKIGSLYHVCPSRFHLFFKGSVLNEKRRLDHYHIKEDSVLFFQFQQKDDDQDFLSITSFPIYIQTLLGKRVKIFVENCDTVRDLKGKVEDTLGYKKDAQKLLFNGKRLCEDNKTLESLNVQSGNTIFICVKLVGGGAPIDKRQSHKSNNNNNNNHNKQHPSNQRHNLNNNNNNNHHHHRRRPHIFSSQSECVLARIFACSLENPKRSCPAVSVVGERGAICFGDASQQEFEMGEFICDHKIRVQPFTLELRMAPKYTVL